MYTRVCVCVCVCVCETERERETFAQGLQKYSQFPHHLFLVAQWSKNKLLRMDTY